MSRGRLRRGRGVLGGGQTDGGGNLKLSGEAGSCSGMFRVEAYTWGLELEALAIHQREKGEGGVRGGEGNEIFYDLKKCIGLAVQS